MTQGALRLVFFLGGLFTLLSWELTAPHHPPTVSRGRRWLANLAFAAINGVAISAVCLACYGLAAREAWPWRAGLFEAARFAPWLRWPLEIALLDLVVYGLHRAYHRVPLLWRFHAVHHSDRDLDVTSASRFHLGEVAVSGAGKLATVVAFGISPTGLVAFEIAMLLAAQFQHANLRLPRRLESALQLVLVPPAMHRVHHHPERASTDSNFGTLLSLWDRLFGSFRRRSPSDREFGLSQYPEAERLGPLRLFLLPFRRGRGV